MEKYTSQSEVICNTANEKQNTNNIVKDVLSWFGFDELSNMYLGELKEDGSYVPMQDIIA